MDGGTYDYFNLLKICNSCHAITIRGSSEDRVATLAAAMFHQLMIFGKDFFPRNPPRRGKHQHVNFLEKQGFQNIIDAMDELEDELGIEFEKYLKWASRLNYQLFRNVSNGLWAWESDFIQKVIIPPNVREREDFQENHPTRIPTPLFLVVCGFTWIEYGQKPKTA